MTILARSFYIKDKQPSQVRTWNNIISTELSSIKSITVSFIKLKLFYQNLAVIS